MRQLIWATAPALRHRVVPLAMGKTRDLFKKIGDTKGIFHAKIGTIKDKNGKDLTEAVKIKKRW